MSLSIPLDMIFLHVQLFSESEGTLPFWMIATSCRSPHQAFRLTTLFDVSLGRISGTINLLRHTRRWRGQCFHLSPLRIVRQVLRMDLSNVKVSRSERRLLPCFAVDASVP
ncbi:hypothetical protein KP509_26G040000 [Ceratopteris richardii]|uniref:Uncharacterized protein n=1 Tax=Ceratopteris richardii TaxID=49495 RepID=A0A8T2RMJ5_CERRI|nr:hypothetical protein KP509_26G040000 [Ceratopteris richardii]